jgi:hypothetical protein
MNLPKQKEKELVARVTQSLVYVLALCSMLTVVNVGVAKASEAGYTAIENVAISPVVLDGNWTGADEWLDASFYAISPMAKWAYKLDYTSQTYEKSFLIEFDDNTTDTGDRWQICIDVANDGGTAPNTNDVKFEIEGHTTLTCFIGNGTGWTPTNSTGVKWKDSLVNSSPNDNSPHYILELQVDGAALPGDYFAPPHGVRVACYDIGDKILGWQSWPPTPETNPSRWGEIISVWVPEGLAIEAIALVSFVAAVAGTRCFHKPRTAS